LVIDGFYLEIEVLKQDNLKKNIKIETLLKDFIALETKQKYAEERIETHTKFIKMAKEELKATGYKNDMLESKTGFFREEIYRLEKISQGKRIKKQEYLERQRALSDEILNLKHEIIAKVGHPTTIFSCQ